MVRPIDVLIEFDGPLTFTFERRDGGLALAHLAAVGTSARRYLASNTSKYIVSDLKGGLLSIREALQRSQLWIIDVSSDGVIAAAWHATSDNLPEGALPAEGVLLTPELENKQAADDKLARFVRSATDGQIAFGGAPVEHHSIELGFYGKFCDRANELLKQIAANLGLQKSPPLYVGMSFQSSYGVELRLGQTEPAFDDMFVKEFDDADKAREAFDQMMAMLMDEQQRPEAITMVKTSQPVRHEFGKILELISTHTATIVVRTRTQPEERKLSDGQAADRLVRVRRLGYPYNYLYVTGILIGGLTKKSNRTEPNFVIRVQKDKRDQDFRGPVSPGAIQKLGLVSLESPVRAKLSITDEDGKDQSYTLEDIDPVSDNEPHSIS